MLNALLSCDCHLENSDYAPSQRILVVVFSVDLFKGLEGLDRVIEVSHLIAIVANKLEDVEGVGRGFS